MSRLALALMAAAFSLAAAQDEMIDNPEYQGWKGQKAGAWVKWKTEMDMGGTKMDSTTTTKLKELTAEKAVLEQATEMDMGGQKRTMNLPARTAPAKIKKGTDSEGAKVEVVAEGDEEIEVKGTKYKCHWVEMKVDSKQGAMTLKAWRTDKIIGGMAKMTMKTDKMNMTMTALDWKAGE
jgi:hypothetical protein